MAPSGMAGEAGLPEGEPAQASSASWVAALRGPRPVLDPRRPGGWNLEPERTSAGTVETVLTVFLTNRECPWRCVFCDLWKHTLERGVAPGDIPRQIDVAVGEAAAASGNSPSPARQIKLYNAGSFFDARAIPAEDHPAIAERVAGFGRVVVECHPALVGGAVARFRDRLARAGGGGGPALEVALGLETVNRAVLPRLGKGVTPEGYVRAASWLRGEGIDVRSFVLVQPPFEKPGEAVSWAAQSAAFAFANGASVVTLIPVRPGNGALEALAEAGQFTPPTLGTLEEAFDLALAAVPAGRRVFADLWDLERFSRCPACLAARRGRLERLNLRQQAEPVPGCPRCGPGCGSRQPH